MCQAGVEMFEYRLPQSPVEKKILLTHATGVPVCKPSRLNGHAVDVVSVSPGAEPPDDGHGPPLPSPFRVRPKPNLPPTPPYTKASPLHSRLPAFSNSSRQGMLSKKERKARSEKNGLFTAENRMSFEERVKSKFKIKKTVENLEDPDDPYAFPEPDSTGNSPASSSGNVTTPTGSGTMVVQSSPSPIHVDPGCLSQQHSPLSIHSPGPVVGNQSVLHQPQQCGSSNTSPGVSTATTTVPSTTSANQASSGTSSIAKLYPELAEKLERVKPKLDTKIKGRTQGSSTVNRLQTKIAQNRIKDKLKRTHNQDVTSPQRSPVCTPPQRSPVSHDVSSSVTKDPLSERLRHETKSPNLNLSYDGALLRPAGTDGMAIKSMPPPPPPFMGFQNLEQLPDHVISQVGTSAGPAPEKLDLMPPPPYPGLSVGRHSVPFMVEPPPSHLGSSSLSQPPGHRTTISSHHPFFPSGSIGCAQSARQPSPAFLSTIIPVLRTLPRKPKCVLSEKEARAKLKTDSAVRYHSQYIRHKTLNHHYLPFDVAASDEEEEKSEDEDVLPWQQDWFSASSDEEDDEPDDELALHIRTTKLALMRARLRRQFSQSRKSHRSNLDSHASYNQSVLAMIRASREHPSASVRAVELVHHLKPSRTRAKRKVTRKRPCRHKNDNEVQCPLTALPFANHCQKHIMYNVDQQIFDYCTAKFADNTQCCIPVFDIRHELPLCPEHAAKADNYNKGTELKSRPRKKTRPSALTKPPKKGKKKRNQRRNVRPQKPMADSEASGDTEMIMDVEDIKQEVDVEEADVSNGASSLPPTPPVSPPAGQPAPIAAPNPPSLARHPPRPVPKPFEADLPASVLEFADMPSVSEVMEKSFELEQLPLEQASRLLEEQDLHDVLLPDDAFDIFGGRNGEFEPSTEETEALDRALAEASQDVKETLARLSQSMVSGELGNLLGHSLDPTAISGNLPSSRGQHTTATAPAPHVKPAMDSPALYADQQAVGYSQASPTAAVSPSIYPSKQYAPPSHPTTDGQAYVPYRGAAQVTATGDQIIVPGLAMEPQVADVLPDYQNRTLRQQLSVTVPQPSLTIQRRLQLSASPVTASPGRHGSGVASMVTPVTALSVHSPVQAPMTNAHTGWSSPQINPTTTGTTQAYPTAYHNGFPPVKHTSAYYQLPAGTLKYTLSPQVKVENTHFLATHSIGAPASPGNPPKPGHDSANPKASKIT